MARVSILIPAINEAENIEVLLNKLAAILPGVAETTVIDGGSTDATIRVATALGATVVLQQGTGKGEALRQAFEIDHAGDIIVAMDADGSNRPEELPEIIAAIVNGADIAKGSRFMKGGGSTDLTYIRKIGNKLFTSIVNHAWSGEYTDLCYGFMAFRQDALQKLMPTLESTNFQIETEICIKARKLGLKVVEIPSIELKRRYGTSKLRGFHDSLSIAKVVLRELFSGFKHSDNP
jgi:glycosyltransferase involved in cell wall biosynthesis